MRNLEDNRTTIFSKEELEKEEELFEQRSALFFTPTHNIPDRYIGEGEFHVILPLSLPNYVDVLEIQAYQSPKLWVHLIQRQLGIIRWKTMYPARVEITAYNDRYLRSSEMRVGTKALLDALKAETLGRPDGRKLYYLGVIQDDAPHCIEQHYILDYTGQPEMPFIRLRVTPLSIVENPSLFVTDKRTQHP